MRKEVKLRPCLSRVSPFESRRSRASLSGLDPGGQNWTWFMYTAGLRSRSGPKQLYFFQHFVPSPCVSWIISLPFSATWHRQAFRDCESFEPRSQFISRLSMIVWVNVIPGLLLSTVTDVSTTCAVVKMTVVETSVTVNNKSPIPSLWN